MADHVLIIKNSSGIVSGFFVKTGHRKRPSAEFLFESLDVFGGLFCLVAALEPGEVILKGLNAFLGRSLVVPGFACSLHPHIADLILRVVDQVVFRIFIEDVLVKLDGFRPFFLPFPGQAAGESGEWCVGAKRGDPDDGFINFDNLVHVGRQGNLPKHLWLACEKNVADGIHSFDGQIPVLIRG